MRQSLLLNPDDSSIYMQCPMFIARNTLAFSVLQTVYVLKATRQDVSDPTTFLITSCALSEVLPGSTVLSQRLRSGTRCRYWVKLSPDGSYAFVLAHELGSAVQIAVFGCEIRNEQKMALKLLGETSIENMERAFDAIRVAFHPRTDLLAFTMINRLFLWALKEERTETERVVEEVEDLNCPDTMEFCDLFFSDCDRFLAAKAPKLDRPFITAIPRRLQQSNLPQNPEPPRHAQLAKECSDAVQEVPQPRKLSTYRPAFGSGMETSQMEITAGGVARGYHTSSNKDGVRLRLWQEDSKNEEFELTKLPDWDGAETAIPSIRFPKTTVENLKIVLNKPIQSWNTLAHTGVDRFPLIISRDQKSVKKDYWTKQKLESSPRDRIEESES